MSSLSAYPYPYYPISAPVRVRQMRDVDRHVRARELRHRFYRRLLPRARAGVEPRGVGAGVRGCWVTDTVGTDMAEVSGREPRSGERGGRRREERGQYFLRSARHSAEPLRLRRRKHRARAPGKPGARLGGSSACTISARPPAAFNAGMASARSLGAVCSKSSMPEGLRKALRPTTPVERSACFRVSGAAVA